MKVFDILIEVPPDTLKPLYLDTIIEFSIFRYINIGPV